MTSISTAVPTAIAVTSTGSITDGVRGTTGTRTRPTARFTGLRGMIHGGTIPGDTVPGGMDTTAFTRAFPSVRAGVDIPIITAPSATAPMAITQAMQTPGIPITAGGGTIIRERFAREAGNGDPVALQWGGVQELATDMSAILGEAGSAR
jgi:hypothetical protein